MASWVDAILSPLNNATDAVKGIVEIRDQVKFGEAIATIQAQLLAAYRGAIDAQRNEAAMLEENRSLRDRVNKLDDWNAQKERYQMEKLPPGIFLYSLKAEVAEGQPAHYACPNCYHRSLIRVLQNEGTAMGVDHLHCHECGSKYEVGVREKVTRSTRRGSWMLT